MGLAVLADDAGAVRNQGYRQVLQADIMHNLVERPLEESGVDGHEGVKPRRCHPSRHADGVLLRYANIEDPVREVFPYFRKPRALQHSRGYADYRLVVSHQLAYRLGKDL